jgi:hypothetical protein
MRKYGSLILLIILACLFYILSSAHAAEDTASLKPLAIHVNYVEGVAVAIDNQEVKLPAKIQKGEVFPVAVKPFDRTGYDYVNEHELDGAMALTDNWGYPVRDNAFKKMSRENLEKGAQKRSLKNTDDANIEKAK